jgi:NAD-dependent deacetylase
MREEAWRRKFVMDDLYAHAKPGRGHRALARLIETRRMSAIITQNIDGLHQASGVPEDRVIELHGNGTYARCLACARRYELADIRREFEMTGAAPQCECGGYIKSATISFGQAMPEMAMLRAEEETLACDLFIAIGSSLVVYPAAGFPLAAKRRGASLVIVNNEPTPLDEFADLVLRGDIGDFLDPLAA